MKGRKRHRLPGLVIRLLLLGIIVFAGIVGYVCIREGSVLKEVPAAEQYDAIIVLGAQVRPDGTPSVQLGWRLDAACEAYEKKAVPIIVCGAQGRDEPMTEAEAMTKYLTARGVPETDILQDPDSVNTNQNLETMLNKRYQSTVHIDNETVLKTFTDSKEFREAPIDLSSGSWSQAVIDAFERIDAEK